MDHLLTGAIEKAFGWSGPDGIGQYFARGSLTDSGLCSRLLTPTRLLDLVMRRSLAPHRLRCLVNCIDLHPQGYITQSVTRRGYSVPVVDMRRLGLLLESGCTLIMDQANAYDPTMEVACRALQWWSHEPVQVNTYLTTGDAAGFELHWDDHDVIVVQLAGEKSWEVRGLSRPVPMFRDAMPNYDPPDKIICSETMKAGDVMHIPRGYWHRATRQDRGSGFSLHASFGFHKPTGVDWLVWIADQSRENELFRHGLNRWSERTHQQEELIKAATRLVEDRSFLEFLAVREQERSSARHIATHGLFGSPADVVCVTDFPPSLEDDGDVVTVSAAGKEIKFAPVAFDALRLLLSGRPVTVGDVTTATGVDATTLTDVLVTEDICAELTPELLSGYTGLLMT